MASDYDSDTDSDDSKGTLSTDDGAVFIKPATPEEIDFYDTIRNKYEQLASLCPPYYGSLTFTPEHKALIDSASQESYNKDTVPGAGHHEVGKHEQTIKDDGKSNKIKKIERGIALESLTHGFKEPNTLDVKLGAILYDQIAKDENNQEKIARFRKTSNETTSKNWSFRFAGMKVFKGHGERHTATVDGDGFTTYGKKYGQSLQDGDVHDAFRDFLFQPDAGVDAELGRYVAEQFLKEVRKMVEVLDKIPLRMYSASILFVYEGDGDRLRDAIQEKKCRENCEKPTIKARKIFECKLIDFAHATIGEEALETHLEPEEVDPKQGLKSEIRWVKSAGGKDENTLKGIRNVVKVLEQVKDQGPLTKAESVALAARVAANAKTKAKADALIEAGASKINGSQVNGTE